MKHQGDNMTCTVLTGKPDYWPDIVTKACASYSRGCQAVLIFYAGGGQYQYCFQSFTSKGLQNYLVSAVFDNYGMGPMDPLQSCIGTYFSQTYTRQ